MTATCLLLLARDGHFDLDADITASLPELRLSQPVTFRQCLTHTAGVRDYFGLCDIAGIGVLGITEDRFMDLAVGQADLDFPPGSAFSYSNTGYALAAVLVRRLTGMSLARFASERVFGPLGMTVTHFRYDARRPRRMPRVHDIGRRVGRGDPRRIADQAGAHRRHQAGLRARPRGDR